MIYFVERKTFPVNKFFRFLKIPIFFIVTAMLSFEWKAAENASCRTWQAKIFLTLLLENNTMMSRIVDQNLKILQSPTSFSDVYQNKIQTSNLDHIRNFIVCRKLKGTGHEVTIFCIPSTLNQYFLYLCDRLINFCFECC
jgi:hypothetical protein